MNSNDVNRVIRAVVRPILKDHGFSAFTTRSAWRQTDHTIHVVNFQSFNSYNADVIGCSTFSFAVNLGVFLKSVPADAPVPLRSGILCPDEALSHFRRRLHSTLRTLPQYPDVWLIDDSGSNTEETVQTTALALLDTGMPWFDAFHDQRAVLSILQDSLPVPDAITWPPGNPGSAVRNVVTGYVAAALGDDAVAESHLRQALRQYRHFDTTRVRGRGDAGRNVPGHLERAVSRYDLA